LFKKTNKVNNIFYGKVSIISFHFLFDPKTLKRASDSENLGKGP